MDLDVKINGTKLNINSSKFHKMLFIFNALENGWSIKKKNKNYIFVKNHENKREIFSDDYLNIFMKENSNLNTLFI
jgi:hypothetical protein